MATKPKNTSRVLYCRAPSVAGSATVAAAAVVAGAAWGALLAAEITHGRARTYGGPVAEAYAACQDAERVLHDAIAAALGVRKRAS